MMKNDDFYNPHKQNVCACCHGTGVQRNQKTGLVQQCPCCFGSGKKRNSLIKKPIYISRSE
jgi:hypothetical protein